MSIEPKATSDTTNFGLTKPDPSDHYDIEVFNQNFDIIDQALQTLKSGVNDKANKDAVQTIQTSITEIQNNYVPKTRTINNNPLSGNIILTANDIKAVPTTRKINNKALSSDISLTYSDVNAVPTTRTINGKTLSSNIVLTAENVNALPQADAEPDTTTTQKTIGGWNVNYIKIGYKLLYVRISKTFTGGLARQDHVKQSITLPFSTVREYKLHATLMVGWALDSRPALGYIDGTEFWITTAEAITNDITFEAFGVISVEEDV